MRFVVLAALLAGCTPSGIIDPVESELAARVLAKGGTPLRMMVATAGVIAGACDEGGQVSSVDFQFHSADVLNITTVVNTDEAPGVWIFQEVGLDGLVGTLTIEGNASHTQYDAVFVSDTGADTMQITYSVIQCAESTTAARPAPPADTGGDTGGDTGDTGGDTGDTGGDTGDTGGDTGDTGGTGTGELVAVLSATGVYVSGSGDDATAQIELKGSPPTAGLKFSPNEADYPSAGYGNWTNSNTGEGLLLSDAVTIDSNGNWPAIASDSSWTRDVTVAAP